MAPSLSVPSAGNAPKASVSEETSPPPVVADDAIRSPPRLPPKPIPATPAPPGSVTYLGEPILGESAPAWPRVNPYHPHPPYGMGWMGDPVYYGQQPTRLPFGDHNTNNNSHQVGNGNSVAVASNAKPPPNANTRLPALDLASSDEDAPVARKKGAPLSKKKEAAAAAKKKKAAAAAVARKKLKARQELLASSDDEEEDDDDGSLVTQKVAAVGEEPKKYYSNKEVSLLLDLVEEMKPNGGTATWQMLEFRFNKNSGLPPRELKSLRNKFKALFTALPPTGDPNCPPHVRRAKRIKNKIMYGNGATTATDGVTKGDQPGADGGGNAFVSRRPTGSREQDHMSMPDLLLHSQEQSVKRAEAESKRLVEERAWMEKCRREREEREEQREDKRQRFTLQLLTTTVTQLASIFNGPGRLDATGGGIQPPVDTVAVVDKAADKPSLSVESPDVSPVSSKSSVATPGKYREILDGFMEQNYNLDACLAEGARLAIKERTAIWRSIMDPNNEDPWQFQPAKAKALSSAELDAHNYVRKHFDRRKEKNERTKTRFIVRTEGRVKRAREHGAASVQSKRSKDAEIQAWIEKTDEVRKSTETGKPPANEK
jgi:hypothetical protein